ncbi:MAG: hypothetical protein M5U26_10445 [Planctomycetota bacterium]|nr:hypothetical protein [Planctomycetota bacterium]
MANAAKPAEHGAEGADCTQPDVDEIGQDVERETRLGVLLQPATIITEAQLAHALGRHPVTIRRAVERGELPPPVRLMGKPTWTGAAILKHLEARLEQARESADVFNRHRATFQKKTDKER